MSGIFAPLVERTTQKFGNCIGERKTPARGPLVAGTNESFFAAACPEPPSILHISAEHTSKTFRQPADSDGVAQSREIAIQFALPKHATLCTAEAVLPSGSVTSDLSDRSIERLNCNRERLSRTPVSGFLSYVMPRFGMNLADYLRGDPGSSALIVKWMKDLMVALVICESRGVIHRDVQPRNLLVRSDLSSIALSNWRHAQYAFMLESGKCQAVTGANRHYHAPELVALAPSPGTRLDRVDVWAMGIIARDLRSAQHVGWSDWKFLDMVAHACLDPDPNTRPSAQTVAFMCDVMPFTAAIPMPVATTTGSRGITPRSLNESAAIRVIWEAGKRLELNFATVDLAICLMDTFRTRVPYDRPSAVQLNHRAIAWLYTAFEFLCYGMEYSPVAEKLDHLVSTVYTAAQFRSFRVRLCLEIGCNMQPRNWMTMALRDSYAFAHLPVTGVSEPHPFFDHWERITIHSDVSGANKASLLCKYVVAAASKSNFGLLKD